MTLDLTMQFINNKEYQKVNKTIVKVIDYLGRVTPFEPNKPLIFIFSDGTRERVMKLEE